MMMENLSEIKAIIIKSVFGELTGEEQLRLDQWRKESDKNDMAYQRMTSREQMKNKFLVYQNIDLNEAEAINIRKLKSRARRRVIVRFIPYAAILVIIVAVWGIWKGIYSGDEPENTPVALVAGTRQAELVLGNGQVIHLKEGMDLKIREQESDISVADNMIAYVGADSTVREVVYNTIRIPHGGEFTLTLSDGTKVWLNAMSELEYPVRFTGELREVKLKGEGYFEVTQDQQHPFVVKTSEIDVRVLGTSFNVYAYPEESRFLTTLCTGKVQVQGKDAQVVDISPGEQLIFDIKSREMTVKKVDTDVAVAWTKGRFQFENNTMEEVFDVLKRWYPIEVFYSNEALKQELFSGKLPRFDDLQIIIDLMEKVSDVKIEVKGNTLFVK